MIPLKDRNPTTRTAFLTFAFLGLNVAAFLFWQPTLARGPDAPEEQALHFFCNGLIPWEVVNQKPLAQGGSEAVEALAEARVFVDARDALGAIAEECPDKSVWLSFLTSMFMHGSWLHIAGNMLFLWVFGNNVEDKVGHPGYLVFYVAAGVLAALAQVASDPGSAIPMVGASGAIAGVLGAYLVMFPRRRVLTLVMFYFITAIEIPAVVLLGFWFVLQFFQGVGALSGDVGGVAVWAHIGGFVAGVLAAFLLFPRERGDPHRQELFWR